jgi:hypothetical protein
VELAATGKLAGRGCALHAELRSRGWAHALCMVRATMHCVHHRESSRIVHTVLPQASRRKYDQLKCDLAS